MNHNINSSINTSSRGNSRLRRNNRTKMVALILLAQFLWPQAFATAATLLEANGAHTVAGYPSVLTSSQTNFPNQSVTFHVKKPNGEVIHVPASTDGNGIARADFSDYHTRRAGEYFVSIVLNGKQSEPKSFMVYADKVSPAASSITAIRTIAKADGEDKVSLRVQVTDQYKNPLAGHQIQLISDRGQDIITSRVLNGLSDQLGNITFDVASKERGIATFSAIDTTANAVLSGKTQVAFISGEQYLADTSGGNFIPLANAAFGGSLSHFDFTNLPSTIQPGQNVSFALTALDDGNQIVQNYMGKIHFSAEGSNGNNVSLPEDYTFKAEDLGIHQFSLGLSFTSSGTYKIVATDLDNPLIKGTKDVIVGGGGNPESQQQGIGSKPTIATPSAGTYSQKTQTVSGSGPAGSTVKIFDNEQEIGSVQVANDGKYSFQMPSLTDGLHKIHVTALDQFQALQGTSDIVEFGIDSTAPSVDDVTLKPASGIQAGQVITIDVTSEPNLSQAAAVFNGDIVQLNASVDKPDHYIGSVQAPNVAGVSPIDIILVDQLGNEGSYKAKALVTVGPMAPPTEQVTQETTQVTQQETQTQTQIQNTNTPPSNISGLLSYAGDKKVTLVWDAGIDNTLIKHYRVYYGIDATNLSQHADTKDAATTWYIPNLDNGKEYYFSITAFDDEGMESSTRSEIITGIPFVTETSFLPKINVTPVVENVGGNDALHGAYDAAVAPRIPGKPGPEMVWIISGAGFLATMAQRLRGLRKGRK